MIRIDPVCDADMAAVAELGPPHMPRPTGTSGPTLPILPSICEASNRLRSAPFSRRTALACGWHG
jgi:hypothetical protein